MTDSAFINVELVRETCWCGMPFMLPRSLDAAARNRGHTIYCPLGHPIVWKETEADRLRRERDRLKQNEARLEEEKAGAERSARHWRESAEKAEKEAKRLKKRAAAGTCPCCQRTFSNMSEHIKRQHPNYVKETGAKIVPLKSLFPKPEAGA